ncbi:MAG: hypothetical protein V2A56_10200 [bacterium]
MRIVNGKGIVSLLPEVTGPSLALIDVEGICPMKGCEKFCETPCVRRRDQKVIVVWHQTPCQNADVGFLDEMSQQVAEERIILIPEKHLLPPDTPLSNMMRNSGDNNPICTPHNPPQ